ncbi:hypothetical protein BC827DRAFT_898576 [Russula dissimulans]|nr:hypothetical protein BC827DRAFT_898576 [Russula dissimulans]
MGLPGDGTGAAAAVKTTCWLSDVDGCTCTSVGTTVLNVHLTPPSLSGSTSLPDCTHARPACSHHHHLWRLPQTAERRKRACKMSSPIHMSLLGAFRFALIGQGDNMGEFDSESFTD